MELAYSGPDGAVARARLFALDELEEALDWAESVNGRAGHNVYIGAALREETVARDRRGGRAAMSRAPALWADFDAPGEAEQARAVAQDLGIPPHFVVTTGRDPELRQQFWWLLEEPYTDGAALTAALKRLQALLGGDASVCEPGRVMRLAGTVAWPNKPGRVTERTSLERHSRPPYAPHEIEGVLERAIADAEPPGLTVLQGGHDRLGRDDDGTLSTDWLVQQAMSGGQDGAPSGWRPAVLRLIAHYVSQGWGDAQISALAPLLTRHDLGYDIPSTRREIMGMALGARRKWGVQDPTPQAEPPARWFDSQPVWLRRSPPAQIIEGLLVDQSVALIYGPPGAGKSFFAIDLACHVAAGRPYHGRAVAQRRVAMLTGEGALDVTARIAVWRDWHHATPDIHHSAVSAKIVRDEIRASIIDELRALGAGLLIVDTVRRAFLGNENAQEDAGGFIDACAEIVEAIQGPVVLIHHAAKGDGGGPRGSSIFESDSDTIMCVHREDESPLRLSVTMPKQKMLTPIDRLNFKARKHSVGDRSSLILQSVDAPSSVDVDGGGSPPSRQPGRRPNFDAQVMAVLRAHGPQRVAEIAERVDRGTGSVSKALARLRSAGLVKKIEGLGWSVD